MGVYRAILCMLMFFGAIQAEDLSFLSSSQRVESSYNVDGKVFVWGVQENVGRIVGGFDRVVGRIEVGQGLMVSDAYGKVAIRLDSWRSQEAEFDDTICELFFAEGDPSTLLIDIQNISGLFESDTIVGQQGQGVLTGAVEFAFDQYDLEIPIRFRRVLEDMWVVECDEVFSLDVKDLGFELERHILSEEMRKSIDRQIKIFFRLYFKKSKKMAVKL